MSAFQLTAIIFTLSTIQNLEERRPEAFFSHFAFPFIFMAVNGYLENLSFVSCSFVSGVYDGPGGVLAKSSYPREGAFVHFDESETWTHNSDKGNISIILFK